MNRRVETVAIVLARGGSKRIPMKNVREFLGKPLIAHAVETLRASDLFDVVVVSTDDDRVAEVAAAHGAELPFRRPPELSNDHTTTDQALLHALRECRRLYGRVRRGCCVYPTPFLHTADLAAGLELLVRHGASSSFPVVPYDFPVDQAFLLEHGVRPRPRWPEAMAARSQDLPVSYHDAGIFYWFDVERFERVGELFSSEAVGFPIPPERCQDINTMEDWRRAELKFRMLADS